MARSWPMTYWSSFSLIERGDGMLVNGVLRDAAAAFLLVDDRLAELDALAADVDVARPFDERADVAVACGRRSSRRCGCGRWCRSAVECRSYRRCDPKALGSPFCLGAKPWRWLVYPEVGAWPQLQANNTPEYESRNRSSGEHAQPGGSSGPSLPVLHAGTDREVTTAAAGSADYPRRAAQPERKARGAPRARLTLASPGRRRGHGVSRTPLP